MALANNWAHIQRKAINLPPTLRTTARGVPLAPRINLGVRAPHDSHDAHDHGSARTDYRVPEWASRTERTVLGGLKVRGAINAAPSLPYRLRHFSTVSVARQEPRNPQVPDYSGYTSQVPEEKGRAYSYFMIGTMGLITAAGTKSVVADFLANLSASADVLALAKVEVDLSTIPEGKNVIIKWRGKPVFVRHRTQAEIDEANKVDVASLRDPQKDSDRVQKPEWLVMLGVCTHLGCVPIGEAGDYGGWFCPCHGSHYDISGRVRRGPAPLNLEIPEYTFPEEGKLVIG